MLLELRPKLLKIENFTIEDDPGGAILVENRLVPTREIDDAEPPHTERAAALDKGSLIIRAPVNDGLTHAVDQGRLDGFSRGTDNASYSAHGSTSRSYGCVIDVARVERRRLDTFQAIIAILTRIAIAPIACRKHDVDHFTRSHKV